MIDQTQFVTEEPLWEEISDPAAQFITPEQTPSKWQSWPAKLGFGVVIFIILMLLMMWSLASNRPKPKKLLPSPTPTVEPILPDEFTQKLQTVRKDLNAAEPNQNPLPFPQVNLTLQLEDNLREE